MADSLYRNKSSLEVIFRILDKDNSGMAHGTYGYHHFAFYFVVLSKLSLH